jgi:Mn-dependent DtxR family transcriptional regulator
MSEEIISMLSNLGALNEQKAVSTKLLNNSERLRNVTIEDDIKKLEENGYVRRIDDDKLYLTKSGLVRALSRYS